MLDKGTGIFILRLFIGIRLIYGVWDNIISWHKMQEFGSFLSSQRFPLPLISAVVSVWAQFICGLMIIVGFKIRWAAAIMVINFLVATWVHRNDKFEAMTPALAILFCCLLFFLEGAGKFAIDKIRVEKTDRL